MVAVTFLILLGELKLFLGVNVITAKKEILQNIKVKDKSREFVNLLKDDLRRNNDDYLDSLPKNTSNLDSKILITSTFQTTTVKKLFNIDIVQSEKYDNFKDNLIDGTNRRALDVSMDNVDTKTREFTRHTSNTFPRRFTKVTKSQPVTKSLNNKILRKKQTKLNVKKFDNVKSFLEKNKTLLKDFVSKKMTMTLTQAVKTTKESTAFRMRAEDPYNVEDHTSPNDEQLDMAPAKGGRIHAMRIKGRLCQRNVLMPEGPKYDSKGNVYLSAFSPKPGQDYAKTVPPKIVLPRCCNCCKKSVLGCE